MAWTSPSGHVWTTAEIVSAANMNTYIKDDLIDLDRRTTTTAALVATDESTASAGYVALATAGPAVTVTIGSTGLALVALYAQAYSTTANAAVHMTVAVSGATTIAPSDGNAIKFMSPSGAEGPAYGATILFTALTAGSNTFTANYRGGVGTAHFLNRRLAVTPLGS